MSAVYGRRVARYWIVRPSECADNVSQLDGKSMCFAADEAAHAKLTERQRRVAHDRATGPRWLPWWVRDLLADLQRMQQWQDQYGPTA